MSSGWTQKLNAAVATPDASSSSSADAAAAERIVDSDHLGQGVSIALAQRFQSLLVSIAADNDDGSAQQELMDRLRLGVEGNGDSAAAAPSTADVSLTLASFSAALHQAQSFSLLAADYTRVLDQLSWDLCDVLLPALDREWARVAATTEASGVGEVDASVDAIAAAVSARARPLASPVLGLLLHLLDEIGAHANPRELALTLLAFYEKRVHDDDEQETEGHETDQEHEEETKADASAPTTNPHSKLSTFHRLGMAFPLLDLLTKLMTRMTQPASAAATKASAESAATASATASAPSSSSLVLSNRQVELYQQLLVLLNSTLARIGHEVYARSESQQAFFDRKADRARFLVERNLWVSMHTKMGQRSLEIVTPVLASVGEAASSVTTTPAAASSAAARAAAAAPPSPASSLRCALLSFLFNQLCRFWSLYSAEAPELQAILDGSRAHAETAAAAAAAQSSSAAATALPFSLTPRLVPLLSLLFHLMSALDSLRVTPSELWTHFVTKRTLEKKIEAAEMDAWEREDDTLAGGDEEDDEEGSDGNAHDDEYDSGDEFGENAALKAFDRQRKPPSLLSQLRKAQQKLPSYNIQGVGLYCATALGFQYFTREKPRRAAEAAAAGAPAPAATDLDQPLTALLASLPDIGRSFWASCASASSLLFLNALGPYLSGLLVHGLSSGEAQFVGQAVALSTAAWALIPPGAVCIAEPAGSGGQSGAASETRNLESSGVWMLNESVLQGLFLCPPSWPSVRSSLLLLWKNLLSCLGVNTRARLLQLSISVCSVPSIQAVVLQRLKDEIVAAWSAAPAGEGASAASDSEELTPRFLNPDLLATLHSYVSQASLDLHGSIDFLLALINLFRFCLIREKADAEATQTAKDSSAASASVVTAGSKRKGGRVGLLLPAVRSVWSDQWRNVAAQAAELAARLDDEIAHPKPKTQAGRPIINLASGSALSPQEAQEDAAQAAEEQRAENAAKILMRNQVQMAAELCKGIVEQLA